MKPVVNQSRKVYRAIALLFKSIFLGGAPLVRTEKVRTGKCQNKKQEKVRTDFVLTVLVPKQENVRTENARKEFVLTV